jgi:hypothetical protein
VRLKKKGRSGGAGRQARLLPKNVRLAGKHARDLRSEVRCRVTYTLKLLLQLRWS